MAKRFNYEEMLGVLYVQQSSPAEYGWNDNDKMVALEQLIGVVETRVRDSKKGGERLTRWRKVSGRHGDERYKEKIKEQRMERF